MDTQKHTFYVYTLTVDETVFYVGFSHTSATRTPEQRWQEHCSQARLGADQHVYRKIRRLWQGGQKPSLFVLFSGLTYDEAVEQEAALITQFGRDNLCNETNGGEGVVNMSPAWFAARGQKAAQTKQARVFDYYQKVRCIETGETFPSVKHAATSVGMTDNGLRHRLKNKPKTHLWRRSTSLTFEYVN